MIKCVLFDFDGTLVDSSTAFISIYNELAGSEGYRLMMPNDIEQLRAMSISERCAFLNMPMYRIPFFAAKFLKRYKASVPNLNFNSGLQDLLYELRAKQVAFAVLSSNSKTNISTFFEQKGLAEPDIYCGSNIFGKDKVLAKYLGAKKLKPSEVLYVGDEARDIIACKKLGIPIAWVNWGFDSQEAVKKHNPDHVVTEPSALLHLITGLLAL